MKKLLSLFVLVAAFAFAQDRNIVISPQSIVINPKPSFEVEVFVDKDRSGEEAPVYQIGSEIRVGVRVSEDAYVYLYNVKSNGQIQQIIPNRYDENGENNYLRAGQTKFFPPQDARYSFNVAGPRGLDKVIAVASKDPLNTQQLASFGEDPNFASSNQGEESFAQTLSIVVRPKPQESWVTDTALFHVGSRPAEPRYGTLEIRSSPSGADAFVDGRYVGVTPVRYGTRPGQHDVRVELGGYESFSQRVNLRGGQTQTVSASLNAVRRTGSVTFVSQPSGATVTINGRSVGTTPTNSISLDEGSYQARISAPGYQEAVVDFSIGAGSSQTVRTSLNPMVRTGTVAFSSDPDGAEVYVGGQYIGTTPTASVSFDEGNYQARFVRSGYDDVSINFSVGANSAQSVRAQLRSSRGTLVVQANVGGAMVFINGNQVGVIPNGTGRLSVPGLPAGEHEIVVTAPTFSTFVDRFTIRSGETTEINVRQVRR